MVGIGTRCLTAKGVPSHATWWAGHWHIPWPVPGGHSWVPILFVKLVAKQMFLFLWDLHVFVNCNHDLSPPDNYFYNDCSISSCGLFQNHIRT